MSAAVFDPAEPRRSIQARGPAAGVIAHRDRGVMAIAFEIRHTQLFLRMRERHGGIQPGARRPDAETPVDAVRALAWIGPDDPGD
jgi:hypothetical protein